MSLFGVPGIELVDKGQIFGAWRHKTFSSRGPDFRGLASNLGPPEGPFSGCLNRSSIGIIRGPSPPCTSLSVGCSYRTSTNFLLHLYGEPDNHARFGCPATEADSNSICTMHGPHVRCSKVNCIQMYLYFTNPTLSIISLTICVHPEVKNRNLGLVTTCRYSNFRCWSRITKVSI
jgi:hypothetical protein